MGLYAIFIHRQRPLSSKTEKCCGSFLANGMKRIPVRLVDGIYGSVLLVVMRF